MELNGDFPLHAPLYNEILVLTFNVSLIIIVLYFMHWEVVPANQKNIL